MTEKYPFEVLVKPTPKPRRPGKEFTRKFTSELNAEIYILAINNEEGFAASRVNFENKFTREEVIAETLRHDKLIKEASRLEMWSQRRTSANFNNPESFPCEVCGRKHENYNCCDKCNYSNHICHFCGDNLGHAEFSVCYILEGLGE